MGRPVVATPQALEGLNLVPGHDAISAAISDTGGADEWVQTVLSLLDDHSLRERLGQAGRCYVEKHHCWDACLSPIEPILSLNGTATRPEAANLDCDPCRSRL